jgi:hypothetical protein
MGLKEQTSHTPVERASTADDAPPAYADIPAPVLSNTASASSSSSASKSRARHVHSLPEDQAKRSLSSFGNPYATNATWSPSEQDARLRKLPSLALTMRLQQRFVRKAGDIFDPPCPSMQRTVPNNASKDTFFEPYQCLGKGDLASDGFKSIFIGAIMAPRDISSADWFRFIQDLSVASRLSGAQEALAGITPISKRLLLPGHLVTKLIRYSVIRKREPLIFETVEEWNARFFSVRGVEVFIHNGLERLTGTEVGGAIPPLEAKYWKNNSKAPQLVDAYADSTNTSDEEDTKYGRGNGEKSQGSIQQRREIRLQRRDQRRQRSNADHNGSDKIMMLVVAHRKPASEVGPAVLAQAVLTKDAFSNSRVEAGLDTKKS